MCCSSCYCCCSCECYCYYSYCYVVIGFIARVLPFSLVWLWLLFLVGLVIVLNASGFIVIVVNALVVFATVLVVCFSCRQCVWSVALL